MARRRSSARAESRCRYYIRDQARARGWNLAHVQRGGDVLEEQEFQAFFPELGLRQDRTDFALCLHGEPVLIVEAKNEAGKVDQALAEAQEYIDAIQTHTDRYPSLRVAVGAAGEEDRGFLLKISFRTTEGWKLLEANGFAITAFPTKREIAAALEASDATTRVSVPEQSEFIDGAIEINNLLRTAKIEATLRPKIIGAVTLALYQGTVNAHADNALPEVNRLVAQAVEEDLQLGTVNKTRLLDALNLSQTDFRLLEPSLGRVISVLNRLNIRSVIHSETDFLGMFYEAFLRYGADNNTLGIVFTPRHITTMCVDLVGISANSAVIDVACGTGGFLVAAFDRMLRLAEGSAAVEFAKTSIAGFDTSPTVWALALLNMFFRGDGKSAIHNQSCLTPEAQASVRGRFDRAFLNPPFSQEGEPEYAFIDAALAALKPGGRLAAVVPSGVFADRGHEAWRQAFLARHRLLGVISLPQDLFYPTAAPTSILLAEAHLPTRPDGRVFMGRVANDGFVKLKGRRVASEGNQTKELTALFHQFLAGATAPSDYSRVVSAAELFQSSAGAVAARTLYEWSPEHYLGHVAPTTTQAGWLRQDALQSLLSAVTLLPEVADGTLPDFARAWQALPALPYGEQHALTHFFRVDNGRSTGESNYPEGSLPFVSSGDATNSIVRLVAAVTEAEVFEAGGITVTAFGRASVQPWPFMARGNGGSAVRALLPRYRMSAEELLWFCGQINAQRWRFHYGRMAIKGRIVDLQLYAPAQPLVGIQLHTAVSRLRTALDEIVA